MKNNQIVISIEIGKAAISFLSDAEKQRFYFGMVDCCKHFFQDPTHLAEYYSWQQNQKLKGTIKNDKQNETGK